MRILFINTLYPPYIGGGAEITLSKIVNGLAERGYETAVFSTFGEKGFNVSKENNVTIYRFGIRNIYWNFSDSKPPSWKRLFWHAIDRYNPLARSDIRRVIEEFKPDIVSCHNLSGISMAAWIEVAAQKIPLIQVLHDYYSVCPKATMFRNGHNCEKRCISCSISRLPHGQASNKVTAVVGVSQAVLNKHLQFGLFTQVGIKKIIHNARKLKAITGEAQKQKILTFGFIGTLNLVKGIKPLLEAFVRVAAQSQQPVQLLIGGTGKKKYVAELQQNYASDCILFLGQVDPADFFNRIDVTLVPSLWNDPFPGVVFESLGYGNPVIGTRRGGIPEMIQHEKNGLIYDPDESGALETAMLRLTGDPALLSEMRKNAKPSAAHFLSLDRMIDEYEKLYKQILQK